MTNIPDIEEIAGNAEYSADWREFVLPQRYPDDPRNQRAAVVLRELAKNLYALPATDIPDSYRSFQSTLEAWTTENVDASLSFFEEQNERLSARMRGVGFHGCTTDAVEFLESWAEEMHDLFQAHARAE